MGGPCFSAVGGVDSAEESFGECMDRPRPDGFLGIGIGMVGESGGVEGGIGREGRVGDAGRLANELVVGVLGVLDGLGPGSTGRTGKLLNTSASLRLSRGVSFDVVAGVEVGVGVCVLVLVLPLVGIGGTICHPPTSSSSSMEGKA
jgi:hypothetical protein